MDYIWARIESRDLCSEEWKNWDCVTLQILELLHYDLLKRFQVFVLGKVKLLHYSSIWNI